MLRWVALDRLPALSIVQLHPIVFAILHLARNVLECLGEKVTQMIVVGGVFETEVADISKVFVEFLC
jgi:hypothetical protein